MVASPTQPKPILATVMPNCVAAIYLSNSPSAFMVTFAVAFPSFASWLILVCLTLTRVN